MLRAMFLIATFLFSSASFASGTAHSPSLQLLKCNSVHHGTLWISFAGVISSDSQTRKTYVLEVVHFNSENEVYRKVNTIPELQENSEVRVGPGRFAVEFKSSFSSDEQENLIQVLNWNRETPSSFVGNWQVTSPSGSVMQDQVGCTIL